MDAVLDREFVRRSGDAVIVVAGAASRTVRYLAPVAGLGRIRVIFLMAGLAVAEVLRPLEAGIIVFAIVEAEYHVAEPPCMNVVNQRLHIDGIAGVAVNRARVVAGHAVVDVGPRSAVELEAVVTGVTGVVVDDAARIGVCSRGGFRSRHEREDPVRRNRCLAANLDADAMDLVRVEHRACGIVIRGAGEAIGVGAVADIRKRAGRTSLRRGLHVGDSAVLRRDVGLPLARTAARARRELREGEANVASRQAGEPLVQVVRQDQRNLRLRVCGEIDACDRDIDALGGFYRYTVTRGRSRLSRRPRGPGLAICARGAIIAFAAKEEQAEEGERRNSARADNETCHGGHPERLWIAAVPAAAFYSLIVQVPLRNPR